MSEPDHKPAVRDVQIIDEYPATSLAKGDTGDVFSQNQLNILAAAVPSNQPILGTPDTAVCGGGLPGTFTFAGPHNILFDNGPVQGDLPPGPTTG